MTQQTQSQVVIVREFTRIGRPRKHPIHPGYVAIVAKAHALRDRHHHPRPAADCKASATRICMAAPQQRQSAQSARAQWAAAGLLARHARMRSHACRQAWLRIQIDCCTATRLTPILSPLGGLHGTGRQSQDGMQHEATGHVPENTQEAGYGS
jgi:hypothetical protein